MTEEEQSTLKALDEAREVFADDARALLHLATHRHPHLAKPVILLDFPRPSRTINVNQPSLTLIPNPATGQVVVEHVLTEGVGSWLRVVDATGRVLVSREVLADVARTTLDISDLAPGVYFVTLSSDKVALQSAKLLVY